MNDTEIEKKPIEETFSEEFDKQFEFMLTEGVPQDKYDEIKAEWLLKFKQATGK